MEGSGRRLLDSTGWLPALQVECVRVVQFLAICRLRASSFAYRPEASHCWLRASYFGNLSAVFGISCGRRCFLGLGRREKLTRGDNYIARVKRRVKIKHG